jgi:hypothetical protein
MADGEEACLSGKYPTLLIGLSRKQADSKRVSYELGDRVQIHFGHQPVAVSPTVMVLSWRSFSLVANGRLLPVGCIQRAGELR